MKYLPQSALANILLFILTDIFRFLFNRYGFLQGAEFWSFTLAMTITSAIFFALFFAPIIHRQLYRLAFQPKVLLLVLAINIWHFGIAGTLLILANKYSTAPNVAFIIQLSLAFNLIWETLILKEKQSQTFYLLMTVSFIGLWLLTADGGLLSFKHTDLIALAAAFCFSITDSLSRRVLLKKTVTPEILAFFRPYGFLVLVPGLLLLSQSQQLQFLQIDFSETWNSDILPIAIYTGIAMSLTWIFVNRAYARAPISTIGMIAMLKPLLVLILSIVFLKEGMSTIQLIGALLILGSSWCFINQKFLKKRQIAGVE